jgi:protein-S-isoprenylcysteine O-methyltransferase
MAPLVYRVPVTIALFHAALLAWWVSELRIMVRNRGGTGENLDRGSRVWVVALIVVGTAGAFALSWQGFGRIDGAWPVVTGLVLAGGGMALRAWSVATLGSYFTTAVEVQADHRVIDSGPYRLLRHPSYTGALLTVAGMTLALGTWLGCVVATGFALAGLVQRILVEERALAARLGPAWDAFAQTRRRLIPVIW